MITANDARGLTEHGKQKTITEKIEQIETTIENCAAAGEYKAIVHIDTMNNQETIDSILNILKNSRFKVSHNWSQKNRLTIFKINWEK